MDVSDFIVPIYYKDVGAGSSIFEEKIVECCDGNGFFVGNYLITAAHVVKEIKCGKLFYIKWNNSQLILNDYELVFYLEMPDENICGKLEYLDTNKGDVAVFKLENINSPLQLSKKLPHSNCSYNCDFFHSEQYKNNQMAIPKRYFWKTIGTFIKNPENPCGNYFAMRMSPTHPVGGSSGSPLYCDNEVYGILHGGNQESLDICVFYSSSHLSKFLE